MKIYTDGACVPNPGRGGWAFVVIEGEEIVHNSYGTANDTTNNRMELIAIQKAILFAEKAEAVIYSDSTYAISAIEGSGKIKKNSELIQEIRVNYLKSKVTLEWVRGHNGDLGNEAADYYANLALGL